MSIIFFNVKKWKGLKNKSDISVKGTSDFEIAKSGFEYIKKVNNYIFEGIIVTEYDDIIKLIKQEYNTEEIDNKSYWIDKVQRSKMVYMAVDNIVLSYDYFLVRECGLSRYVGWEGRDKEYNYIFNEGILKGKINKKKFIDDIIMLEIYNNVSMRSESTKEDILKEEYNRVKKIIFTDKSSVEKRLKEYWKLDVAKISERNKWEYLDVLFMFYYLDKHGIYQDDGKKYRVKILDAIAKPRIHMFPNYMEHEKELEIALVTEYVKNEIVKHLSLEQINRIDRIYIQLFHLYNTTFMYIANLVDKPINFVLEEKELSDILHRLEYCMQQVELVQAYENDKKYEDEIWEIVYHRYKGYFTVTQNIRRYWNFFDLF